MSDIASASMSNWIESASMSNVALEVKRKLDITEMSVDV